uniref:Uncharacterized protein n=1 Tax=Panagrolaimus sp. PS1159 TaxID=55785 RepID=A0AC35GG37_9BILA
MCSNICVSRRHSSSLKNIYLYITFFNAQIYYYHIKDFSNSLLKNENFFIFLLLIFHFILFSIVYVYFYLTPQTRSPWYSFYHFFFGCISCNENVDKR